MTEFSRRILGGGDAVAFPPAGRRTEAPAPGAPAAVAHLLDQLAFASGAGEGVSPLQAAWGSARFANLREAVDSLPNSERRRLQSQISPAALEELLSLAEERDPDLFAQSLFSWARNQENADHIDAAAAVYGLLSGGNGAGAPGFPGASEALRLRAGRSLDAVLGRGAIGGRAEFLLRRFAREASNPVMIAGMFAGSMVFSTARTALLSRLLSVPGRSVLGARALASTGAFLLEVPTFWATTKGLNEALDPGRQRWDLRTNLTELASLGLTLGALKVAGVASSGLSRRLASSANPAEWGVAERFGHGLLQQGGTLAGIMLGHRAEEWAGLRPHLDGATNLFDSLALLAQFHVGGRLSQTAMGPRFQAYTQGLELRSQLFEAGAARDVLRAGRNFFDGGSPGPVTALATAAAGGSGPRGRLESRPQDFIVQMSSSPQNPIPGADGLAMVGGPREGGEPPAVLPPQERGIRTDIPAALPERTGDTPDDLFLRSMPPAEILKALQDRPVFSEIHSRLEAANGHWEEIDELQFGAAVGEALAQRLGEIHRHARYFELRVLAEANPLTLDHYTVPRGNHLPAELREALDSAAELMGITQYAIRSNQSELLDAARAQISEELQGVYQQMLPVIRLVKGPRLVMPAGDIARGEEVLGPDVAVLSHGAGAMSSWLRVISRRIRPGELPWTLRLFATEANFNAVRGLRERGKNPFMSPTMSHNFEGDPPIEAIYFNSQDPANSDALARTLYRTVRVQMLNVPAKAMPDIMSEEFIRGLPEGAVLISAIGGVVEPLDEAPQYPNEFVRGRLDRYGRQDVEVVSLSGYVPADKLWSGERVMINLSSREAEAGRGEPVSAAREVARLFAGESLDNDFVLASSSHWERSANVGKVAKNVVTLGMGLRAGRLAREVVEAQSDFAVYHPRFNELLELGVSRYTRARTDFKEMMRNLLVNNEGIKAARADFTPEVWKDFDDCSTIFFDNLVELFRRARQLNTREASADQIRDFLKREVFEAPRDRRVATTRNPRYGIARALHEMWVDMGLPFRDYAEVGPQVTVEGLHSLDPLIRLYSSRRDIEQRRLPEFLYELHRTLFARKLDIPTLVPRHVRSAIDRNPESAEARRMQAALKEANINISSLRQALEGSDERTLNLLGIQLGYLRVAHERLRRARLRGNGEVAFTEAQFENQVEFVRQLKEATARGNVVATLKIPERVGPYENAFVITRQDKEGDAPTHQVYVRINLEEATRRLTQLGMLLRRFPPEDAVEVDVRISELERNPENFGKLLEMEMTSREILRAFQSQRPGELRLSIDRRSIDSEGGLRRDPPSDAFYTALEPLARWVLNAGPQQVVSREEVRQLFRVGRHEVNGVMEQLLREGNGWVMLLTPSEGPIQSGIRAMLTRPEKATLMGVYSGDTLVDTFAVYRFNGREPRILSHHLLNDFRRAFADQPRYQRANSVNFFQGFTVEDFIRDYAVFAEREGLTIDAVRPIELRSTPVEEALMGGNPALNPAILKIFLMQTDAPEAAALLRAAEPLYELPADQARESFARLAAPALAAFEAQHGGSLRESPLYRLYQRFGFLARHGLAPGLTPRD